jgi:ABC-2 type transport system permease protein
MKIIHIIKKSSKEQMRSFWMLLLTLSMGPFFIFVYFLIAQSSERNYNVLIENRDTGVVVAYEPKPNKINANHESQRVNHGANLIVYTNKELIKNGYDYINCNQVTSSDSAKVLLKDKKAHALIVIPQNFSATLYSNSHSENTIRDTSSENKGLTNSDSSNLIDIHYTGDLTSEGYLLSALFIDDAIKNYTDSIMNRQKIINVSETALGNSDNLSEFDLVVPGILIVSIIMMMFTASIAFIWEVENKTITLLKLSNLNPIEYLLGVSSVQTIIGVVAAFLSLGTAIALGFSVGGSVDSMYVGGTQNNISIIVTIFIVSALTSLSIVAFSLIVAACTKSANEILIVGCFPMFLFMFFSGAAFPLNTSPLFSIAGYPLSIQSLMSPTHATSALNKILVMDQSLTNIIPELISISILTIIYLIIGAILFKNRHYGLLSHARKS